MKNRREKILWYAEHHRAAGKAHQMKLVSRHQRRRERWTIKVENRRLREARAQRTKRRHQLANLFGRK